MSFTRARLLSNTARSEDAHEDREERRESDGRESDDREDGGPRDVFAVENSYETFFVLVLLLFKFLFRACTRRCACCW